MRRLVVACFLLVGISPLLVQCVASERDVQGLDLRTRSIDSRLSELEQLKETVRTQSSNQARMGNDISAVNTRLLQYQGRLDEIEHQQGRVRQSKEESQQATSIRLDNIDISLKELIDRLDSISASVNLALGELEKAQQEQAAQIDEIKVQRAREAAERAAAAAAAARAAELARREAEERARREAERTSRPTVPAGGPKEITPDNIKKRVGGGLTSGAADSALEEGEIVMLEPGEELFKKGAGELTDGKYLEAYNTLSSYLDEYPSGKFAVDARFLLGESLFQQKEFELAILEYQKLIGDHPGKPRVADALYRQGLAFEELEEPATAVIIYQRLLAEFPDSNQASQAKERMERL